MAEVSDGEGQRLFNNLEFMTAVKLLASHPPFEEKNVPTQVTAKPLHHPSGLNGKLLALANSNSWIM